MTSVQIFALIWPLIAVAFVVAFAFFVQWMTERAERRRLR
jgi:nitrate reductase NapE component